MRTPDAAEPGDDEALRAFRAGDTAAFESIVRRHQDRVYRLAMVLLREREDAKDAAQEVFVRAYHGLREWRFEAALGTWLYRTTFNVCRERWRRRHRGRRMLERWLRLVEPLLPRDHQAPPDERWDVRRLVDALPPRQREVVLLRIFEDLSIAETAEILGVPEGTVKSNLFKALARLRARLSAEAVVPEAKE